MARLRPADGPFFPFQRSSLLYLLVLSLFASSAIAVAPKISRYDAREQQFEFGGAKVKALTVTATFDQSLYFSPVSTSYKPNLIDARLANCTSSALGDGSEKYPFCLDHASFSMNLPAYDTTSGAEYSEIYFLMNLTNFQTCNGGIVFYPNTFPINVVEIHVYATNGDSAFQVAAYLECEMLRNISSDGIILVEVIHRRETDLPVIIKIPESLSRLPIENFAPIIKFIIGPPYIACDDGRNYSCDLPFSTDFSDISANLTYGCRANLIPSWEDPVRTLFTSLLLSAMSSNPAIDFDTKIVANTLSVAFLTEYVPESSQVPYPYVGYLDKDHKVLDTMLDPQCHLIVNSLVNDADETIDEATIPPIQRYQPKCEYLEFKEAKTAYENLVDSLASLDGVSSEESVYVVYLASLFALSDAWTACKNFTDSFLLEVPSGENATYDICSTLDQTSLEFRNNPCCNEALQNSMCCIKATVEVPTTKFIPNPNYTLANADCVLPSCTQPILSEYAGLASSVPSCLSSLTSDIQTSQQFKDPFPYCYASIFGTVCSLIDGSASVCSSIVKGSTCGYSAPFQCRLPCESDADCVEPNYCLEQYSVSGSRYCSTTSQSTNYTETERRLIFADCLFAELQKVHTYAYLALGDTVNLHGNGTTRNDKLLSLIVDNRCVDPRSGAIWGNAANLTACNAVPGICNWNPCEISNKTSCTLANCLDESLAKPLSPDSLSAATNETDGFCAIPYERFNQLVSPPFPGLCIKPLFLLTTDIDQQRQLCPVSGNGNWSYNPLRPDIFRCASAATVSRTPTTCMAACTVWTGSYTGPFKSCARPICVLPSYNQLTCSGAGHSSIVVRQWVTTTIVTNSFCEAYIIPSKYDVSTLSAVAICNGEGGTYSQDSIPNIWVNATKQSLKGACERYGYCLPNSTYETQLSCQYQERACTACDNLSPKPSNCSDPDSCKNMFTCTSKSGCLLPLIPDSDGNQGCDPYLSDKVSREHLYWTPAGCLIHSISGLTSSVCALATNGSGVWINGSASSEAECESTGICRDDTYVGVPETLGTTIGPPRGYNAMNQATCTTCANRTWVPFYKWESGAIYSPNQWTDLVWIQKRGVTKPVWKGTINSKLWSDLLGGLQQANLASVYQNALNCLYGQTKDQLEIIACSCGGISADTKECQAGLTGYLKSISGTFGPCNGVNSTYESAAVRMEVMNFTAKANVTSRCITIDITSVPIAQFASVKKVSISSTQIKSTQVHKGELLYFENDNGIVVSQIIQDGVGFTCKGCQLVDEPIKACIKVTVDPRTASDLHTHGYLDFMVSTDLSNFTNYGIHMPIDSSEICINISANGQVFFLATFMENADNVQYFDTWSTAEVSLMFIAAAVYFALLVYSVYQLVLHTIRWAKDKQGQDTLPYFDLPKLAIIFLTLFLSDRVVYMLVVPFGALESLTGLSTVFADLPALFFLTIFSLTVIRWAEIYHFTMSAGSGENRLRPIIIGFNVLIYAMFIALLALFFAIPDSVVELNCGQSLVTSDTNGAKTVIALIYKAFFLVVCVLVGILFIFYGVKIMNVIRMSGAVTADKSANRRKTLKLILVSAVCAVSLFAQAINLVLSVLLPGIYTPIGVVIFFLIIECIPAGFLLHLYGISSDFVKRKEKSVKRPETQKEVKLKTREGTTSATAEGDSKVTSLQSKSDI